MMLYNSILGFDGEYRFLSNFHPVKVLLDDVEYSSTEHAYQAAKTLDENERKEIRECLWPGKAKKLGQKVTKREDWEDIKLQVMLDLLEQKFAPGTELAEMLKATGDSYIEETNTWNDTFWGICNGKGKNFLGVLLMNIRDKL